MDTARQVVRWSLPGLLFVLNFVLFHALWLALTAHRVTPWAFINQANAPALIALVAGGLPAGFLFYQFYFANYRPVSRWFGLIHPNGRPHYYRADRGGNMLNAYTRTFGGPFDLLTWLEQGDTTAEALRSRLEPPAFEKTFLGTTRLPVLLKLKDNAHLIGPSVSSEMERHSGAPRRCRTCATNYEIRSRANWRLFQTLLDYVGRDESYRYIKAEYTSHSDLYHALGSARSTILLSLLAAGAYDLVVRPLAYGEFRFSLLAVLVAVLVGTASTGEYLILSLCRDWLTKDYEVRIAAALSAAVRTHDPRPHASSASAQRPGWQSPDRSRTS